MGIFPHFFSGSPLTHITHLVLPEVSLFTSTIKAVQPIVSNAIASLHSVGSIQTTPKAAQPEQTGSYLVPPSAPPPTAYQAPATYGPSPFTPSPYTYAPTPDTFSPYGGASWDYSTASSAPSNPQWATYSAPQPTQGTSDRTWEDLLTAATSVAPLFL